VVTLATVGYGDFVPTTPLGKIFTIFYILVGITIFIALARAVIVQIVMRGKARRDKHRKR
jgi:voltage-gated potassium channel Kch